MNIAILMACHNRKKLTLDCLKNLFNAELPPNYNLSVYLVDDGSTDGTSEAILGAYPRVNVISGNGNLYWNRGMQKAWSVAQKESYDFYLWLNDDTQLYENALKVILNDSVQMDNLAIICGTTLSSHELHDVSYGGYTKSNVKIIPNGMLQKCWWFNGNFVLVPRFVFQNVGGLDILFHHFLGDVDYGLRAQKKGIQCFVASEVIGICAGHSNLPNWKNNSLNIFKRLYHLYSPLGCNPFEFYKFRSRHNGTLSGILQFINLHLKVIFPRFLK